MAKRIVRNSSEKVFRVSPLRVSISFQLRSSTSKYRRLSIGMESGGFSTCSNRRSITFIVVSTSDSTQPLCRLRLGNDGTRVHTAVRFSRRSSGNFLSIIWSITRFDNAWRVKVLVYEGNGIFPLPLSLGTRCTNR